MTQKACKSLIVQKFGGTSVGSIERIHAVAERVIEAKEAGSQLVVVVSAMAGETNRLLDLAQKIDSVPTDRELDVLLSAGEQMSMALLAMTLNKLGHEAVSLTGWQAGIVTNQQFNNASIDSIDTTRIQSLLEQDKIVIVAGFQGITDEGDITTLGRGGSDTTAVALAGALNATECQIFTDVDGVYSCDPRVVPEACRLHTIDFPTMEAMAKQGAKVLHLPSVQFAWKNRVPLRVLSSFTKQGGTLVTGEECVHDISGIALQRDLLHVQVAHEDLAALEKQCYLLGIKVWTVISEAERAGVVIKQDAYAKLNLVFAEKIRNSVDVSSLTCVGNNVESVITKANQLLGEYNISVLATEPGIQCLLMLFEPDLVNKAANIIHEHYVLANVKQKDPQKVVVS
ncbi:aspartate kinase [Photobacterium damselae]|uniref:aspartate kinase n=1 Tax=Photobacterium damselae TaxID=38293 RepID=UPI00406786CF